MKKTLTKLSSLCCYTAIALLTISVGLSGCSKEDMNEMVADLKESAGDLKESAGDLKDSAGDAVSKAKSAVKSAGNLSGKATMTLDSATEFAACYIRLIPAEGGAVLQIKSHEDGASESFPSFLVQGKTAATSLDSLVGKSVPCHVFAQKTNGGGVWANQHSSPVSVTVQKNEKGFTAKFENSQLTDSATEATVAASGSFECAELK